MESRMTENDKTGGERRSGGEKPDSTGPNARPRDDTIAQTAPGIPDDSSLPVELDPQEEKDIEKSIRNL
jgi:hypothetical protein